MRARLRMKADAYLKGSLFVHHCLLQQPMASNGASKGNLTLGGEVPHGCTIRLERLLALANQLVDSNSPVTFFSPMPFCLRFGSLVPRKRSYYNSRDRLQVCLNSPIMALIGDGCRTRPAQCCGSWPVFGKMEECRCTSSWQHQH